ncbi:hypothetical protein LINGRAHAP2_LOCUS12223 [Linum grandiflorum]
MICQKKLSYRPAQTDCSVPVPPKKRWKNHRWSFLQFAGSSSQLLMSSSADFYQIPASPVLRTDVCVKGHISAWLPEGCDHLFQLEDLTLISGELEFSTV